MSQNRPNFVDKKVTEAERLRFLEQANKLFTQVEQLSADHQTAHSKSAKVEKETRSILQETSDLCKEYYRQNGISR